ncbi:ABC transporter ATP-binding protein [Methylocaldum szegediense]|uniref:ATP-binding cassette subfamily C protein n=1 Tax=Methylocaldum szegediense TaxID=73780 RepID=A0ABN8X9W0_9GAMM|nr:ABC transporter ATP-binding protein [Methylocaldum szegediense]CAI8888755.1 ATP-binding cassette subfamily C protein [Methylocaldum szegediense]
MTLRHFDSNSQDPQRFTWAYIRSIALEHRRELFAAHFVAVLAALSAVPVPLLMPLLVDEVLLNKPGMAIATLDRIFPAEWHGPPLYILAILAMTLLLRLITAIFNVWQTRQFSLIAKDVIYRIRCRLISKLQRISMAEYENLGSGSVVTHLVTDLDTLDAFIGTTIARFVVALLSLTGTAVILLWMHWQLALFILFLNPVVIFFTKTLGKQVKNLKREENSAIGAFQLALTETLDAIHQIRASNRDKHYMGRLMEAARKVRENSAAYAWKSDAANRVSFLVFLFGFDVFRALAFFMVIYSDLTVGEMMAVSGYLWFMMTPVQEILGIQYAWFGARAALERINQLNELKQEPNYPHLINPFEKSRRVGIYVENLHFAYPNGNEVLRGVSMDIRPGEKVALIGASGGGKSTLVQVLIGLYPPTSGMVYFNGAPIDKIGMDVVREHVVTVLQHPVLFNDTVRANLTLGRPATDEELWRALDVAQLRDVVENSRDGLDTVVGRLGMRLSGGQRQRLAIARMILADPKVVILDEATSAIDNETEARLYEGLDKFLENRTTIIVAHRLSAIKHANRIYVFEDGRICEQGNHETLVSGKGLYARLYGPKPAVRRARDLSVRS